MGMIWCLHVLRRRAGWSQSWSLVPRPRRVYESGRESSRDRDLMRRWKRFEEVLKESVRVGWLWTFVMSTLRLSRWSGVLTTDPTCFLFPGLIIRLF